MPRALTVSVLGAATVFLLAKPLALADLAVFMAMGQWMASQGQLFEQEIYAFTELGRVFVNGTWLAQLIFFELHELGGYALLQATGAALTVFGLAISAAHGRARGGREAAGTLAVVLAFGLALQNVGVRPQTFSIPLFCLAWYLTDQHPRHRLTPAALVLIFGIWPNLHGAFPAALGLMLAQLGGAVLRRRGVARRGLLLVVAFFATWLNPYGPGIYAYVATNSRMPLDRHLDEWLPAEPTSFMGVRLIGSVVLALWVLYSRARREGFRSIPPEDGAVLVAFLWLALGSQRMILWWGLAMAPLVAGHWRPNPALAGDSPGHHRTLRLSQGVWLALVLLAGPWNPRRGQTGDSAEGFNGIARDEGVRAIAALDQRPGGGRVFNKMMWGSYAIWRLWPRYSPYLDPRIWVYSDTTWQGYLDISRAQDGWQQTLDHWKVDVLLLEPSTQGPLIEAARASGQWLTIYADDGAAVLERRPSVAASGPEEERP